MDLVTSLKARVGASKPMVLHIVNGPYVTDGGTRIEVPRCCQRLLVLMALRGGTVDRGTAAGLLWPSADDARAGGALRTALWRSRRAGIDLIRTQNTTLCLRPDALVDLHLVETWATGVLAGTCAVDVVDGVSWDLQIFDLLPGWSDDWVLVERERFRSRLLHAIEALSRHLCRSGRYPQAVDAALTAVAVDPLRESAQRALVEAHLSVGNVAEARRSFLSYRALVRAELAVEPAPELASLVHAARRPVGRQRNGALAPSVPDSSLREAP